MGQADARKAASEAFTKVEVGADQANEKTRAKVEHMEAVKVAKAAQGGVVVKKAREMLADFERRGIAEYVIEAVPEAMSQLRDAAGAASKAQTLLGNYAKRHLSTLRSGGEVKRRHEVEGLPAWGFLDAREITRLTSANRLRLYLSGFFAQLVDREVVEASPVVGVKTLAKELKRDRVLLEDEIRWFWRGCEAVSEPRTNARTSCACPTPCGPSCSPSYASKACRATSSPKPVRRSQAAFTRAMESLPQQWRRLPRKSAEKQARPDIDHSLADEEAEVWRAVIESWSADWIGAEALPLLSAYCRTTVALRRLGQLINQHEFAGGPMNLAAYSVLLKDHAKQAQTLKTLGTSLKLAPQSRDRARRRAAR